MSALLLHPPWYKWICLEPGMTKQAQVLRCAGLKLEPYQSKLKFHIIFKEFYSFWDDYPVDRDIFPAVVFSFNPKKQNCKYIIVKCNEIT